MPKRRIGYVTVPKRLITGTKTHRNRTVKNRWIRELGGKCKDCGEVYKKIIISQKCNSRVSKKIERSNLDAHYYGKFPDLHIKYQLGKLQVPMKDDLAVQKDYFTKFIKGLCPCKLLCKHCHRVCHARKVSKCMRMHKNCSVPTHLVQLVAWLILCLLTFPSYHLL